MKRQHTLSLLAVLTILALSIGKAAAQEPPTSIPLFMAAVGAQNNTWSIVMLDPTADEPQYLTDDTYDEIAPIASVDSRYVIFLRGDFTTDAPFTYYILDRECLEFAMIHLLLDIF